MTQEKWDIAASIHNYSVAYEAASPDIKKGATYHFLENHMMNLMGVFDPAAEQVVEALSA